ncbi:MAG: outer membrane lipoprotein-sorting protein [Bacteroidales bacterium]|nr:outer membrane lipoprotein-sorting protein [Bacteroidales bacterium]
MKKIFLIAAVFSLFTFHCAMSQAQQLTGREIVQKVKNRPDGDTRYAEMELSLKKKNGSARQRKITSWAMDEGKDTKKIMFFTYPGDVKGTGFLTYDYDQVGKEDDKWLYLPAMKKTRRISGSSSKTDYFMGTDFTYDDMGSRNVYEDTHKLLREEERDGHKCWVVESVPVDKHEIYSRKVSWIRQDCLTAIYVEYYDKLNKLHRVLTISDVKEVQGFWTIHKMEMKNVQTEHSTIITVKNPKYNIKIDKTLFTVAKLEKGL